MKSKRRNHSASFKASITAVRGDKTAEQFDFNPAKIQDWRLKQLDQANQVL